MVCLFGFLASECCSIWVLADIDMRRNEEHLLLANIPTIVYNKLEMFRVRFFFWFGLAEDRNTTWFVVFLNICCASCFLCMWWR